MNQKYKVRFTKKSKNQLKKLDKSQSLIIMGWIKKNLEDSESPRKFGKSLSGTLSGAWRYRIGDYRLIADINDQEITILVLEVEHRKDIYK